MSRISDSMTRLQAAVDRNLGAQTVDINGMSYSAMIEDVNFDEVVAAGGIGESGGFRASVNISVLATKPAQLTPITARGQALQVLEVINTNGVTWTIIAGDPADE